MNVTSVVINNSSEFLPTSCHEQWKRNDGRSTEMITLELARDIGHMRERGLMRKNLIFYL